MLNRIVNVLLITITYPPEIRAISLMMKELAEELTLRSHKVTVATSQPRDDLRAEGEQNAFSEFSVENGINVIRVRDFPRKKTNYLVRGIAEVFLPYLFMAKLKKFVRKKVDAVIVYTPPLPLALLGIKVKKVYGARYLLNVQDIFPQNAIDLGIIKNRLLVRFFEWIEKRAYNEADRITVHSQGNRQFLIYEKKVLERKVSTIYNWIDLTQFKQIEKTGIFRKRYRLDKKFIFLHAGIMGPAQGLDLIIQAAREVREITDICFLLVGDGSEKQKLEQMAEAHNLRNVVFKPFVSKEEYPLLAKDADVGLACLNNKNKTPVYPGKLLGYMASSIPIVAFLNEESDGHQIIKEAGCGYSEVSDDYKKAVELILRIYNERDKLAEYGHKGFEYAAMHFSKEACIDKLEKLLQ